MIQKRHLLVVCTLIVFGVGEQIHAAPILYGIDEITDQLVSIDRNTGVATAIGNLNVNAGGGAGLAFDPNSQTLYFHENTLYSVDTSTGAATTIGGGVGTISGLAFDPNTNTLHAGDGVADRQRTLNAANGTPTDVGPFGASVGRLGEAFDPAANTLFMTDETSDTLYSIDTSTGAATAIGLLGNDFSSFGLAFDTENNVLFGVDTATDQLLSINPLTGTATAIGPTGFSGITALAFDPGNAPVPEPASLALWAMLCLTSAAAYRRRKHSIIG